MNTLQKLSYGEYIVTSVKNEEEMATRNKDFIAAATVNWAMQTSFEPAKLAIALQNQSDLQETVGKSRKFTLHILGKGQKDLIKEFASENTVANQKINGIPYEKNANDQIILKDSVGYISCEIEEIISEGDHVICLSKVLDQKVLSDAAPLTTESTQIQYTK